MGFFTLIFNIFILYIIYKAGTFVWQMLAPPPKKEGENTIKRENSFFKIDKSKAEDVKFEEIKEE